jgi:hypothetical protein
MTSAKAAKRVRRRIRIPPGTVVSGIVAQFPPPVIGPKG